MTSSWTNLGAAAPLSGLRVLELAGEVATRYCGSLFARLGAEVVQLAANADDDRIGYGGDAGRAFGRWLDQAKTAVEALDMADQRFDLVIAGQDAASRDRVEAITAGLAGIVGPMLSITWFDPDGPYRDWHGTDEVLLALSGLTFSFGERSGPPTLAQGHVPQVLAGAHGFIGAMAALLERPDRRPRHVAVNVFESILCLTEIAAIGGIDDDRIESQRLGVNRFSPTYPCASYRTADGWVGVTCLTPGQWRALCGLLGRSDLADDPSYATSLQRLALADEVDAVLVPALQTRTTAQWVADGMAQRIPMAPMVPPGHLADQEHWRQRGTFAPLADGDVQAPAGPIRCRFEGSPRPRWEPNSLPGPLAGIRVVDFSMGWAGPWATRTLADLGADVIKVESEAHPDWWRGWEADRGGDPPPIEMVSSFNTVNRNKRGVALDLTDPQGLEAAKALVARADVVVENFAAGVLEKLGLGQAAQRQLRPGIISIAMSAFGTDGPLSPLRAYGSTVEQASGMPFANGREDWPPSLQHVAFGDPVAGVYAVTGLLTALWARDRLGGADLDLAQVACLFELTADAVVAQQVNGGVLARTGNRRPRLAPCCVVPGAGEDEWLAVVVDSQPSWHALCRVIQADRWVEDPSLATLAGRHANADAIEAGIAGWAAHLPAGEAAERLQRAGVAAAPVNRATSLGADPQLLATGFWQTLVRRYVGEHTLGASPLHFDRARPTPRCPAPTLGQHTSEVLEELGVGSSTTTTPAR